MNVNLLSQAAKWDIAASVIMLSCILAVAVAVELSAPLIAGLGAAGAAVTGIARLAVAPSKKK